MPGPEPKGGSIEIDGKPVKVALRNRNARITLIEPVGMTELAKGFWKCTIHGGWTDGRFVIEKMEVQPLVDPRTLDDPGLPRVLVVGDSISMNYHDAAKAALKGRGELPSQRGQLLFHDLRCHQHGVMAGRL